MIQQSQICKKMAAENAHVKTVVSLFGILASCPRLATLLVEEVQNMGPEMAHQDFITSIIAAMKVNPNEIETLIALYRVVRDKLQTFHRLDPKLQELIQQKKIIDDQIAAISTRR